MRTLLVLFGLFTVGNAIQCPRCTSYDYSKAKGITDEERRNSATKLPGIPECNAPDMQTCADTMRCSTFRLDFSLDIDGRTADIDGVVLKGQGCDFPSITCSAIEKLWETQLGSGVDVEFDDCYLELCDENGSCVTRTGGVFSPSMVLATTLPLLRLLL